MVATLSSVKQLAADCVIAATGVEPCLQWCGACGCRLRMYRGCAMNVDVRTRPCTWRQGAAVLAACGNTPAPEIGRVGTGATQPTLAEAPVTDAVLARTGAAYETSIASAYKRILDGGYAKDHSDLVKAFEIGRAHV